MKIENRDFIVLPVLLFLLFFSLSSFSADLDDADALGCRDGIVNLGDSKSDVLEKCGEPTQKQGFQEYLWIYDFGPSNLIYYLTFTGERLERIQIGGYGH